MRYPNTPSEVKTPNWLRIGLAASMALTAVATSSTALAAGADTKLTRETAPVNPEADSQFTIHEVKNLEKYFKHLAKEAKKDEDSAEKHIWSLIGPARQAELTRWEKEDKYSDNMRFDLIVALNQIVRRDDVYFEDLWADRDIPEELRNTYKNEFKGLNAVDKARANRKLFAATWPDYIAAPVKPDFVVRPKRVLEEVLPGDKFLGSGDLQKGFTLPFFGSVWQPNFLIFGNVRSRLQTFDPGAPGADSFTEWVNALNINLNLALTPTERLVVTFTPLNQGTSATGYQFDDAGGVEDGFEDYANGDPQTFFFEGDFGELFPNLDVDDKLGLDFGFAVGRQPIQFQRGFMVDDELDSVGITKNNLIVPGTSNLRITGLYAWDEIDRNGGIEDNQADLFGLFTAWDLPKNTIEIDYMYVASDLRARAGAGGGTGDTTDADMALADSTPVEDPGNFGGDSQHIGASTVQRIGLYNTSLHVNASLTDDDTRAAGEGVLVFGDISYTLPHGVDLVYGTAFAAFDEYSAVRRPLALGPLAPAGILFGGPGIGRVGSALSNTANDVAGGALGYQKFYNDNRTQIITEVGGRIDTASGDSGTGDSFGVGVRLQHAIGQHWILQADAAIATVDEGDENVVGAVEARYQF